MNNQQNNNDLQQFTNNQQNTNKEYKCDKCTKVFSQNWILQRHLKKCKGIIDKYSCQYCNKKFKHDNSRFSHYKICKEKKKIDSKSITITNNEQNISQQTINNNNIETQNNIENQNNIQNNITVLAFPKDGDYDFEFNVDHISNQFMKKLLQKVQHPQCKLNNFVDKLMANPTNRVIKKNNPNTSYSKIHKGDDKWEFGYDKDIYKTFTHHTTVAAINKIDDTKKSDKAKEVYYNLKNFEHYVKEVNEMDYESSEYNDILQRLKLIIVNLTKEWEEKDRLKNYDKK